MNPFALAYREQQQLFLFDKAYLTAALLRVGGLSVLVSRFLVQFFWNPYIAMTLTICLLALSSYLLWVFLRNSRTDWVSIILAVVPSCLAAMSLADNDLNFDFITSIIFLEATLVIFKKIRTSRVLSGLVLTILLYVAAGPVALVFALCTVIDALFGDRKSLWSSVLNFAAVLSVGFIAYHLAAIPTLGASVSPSFHYELEREMPFYHWCTWIAIPIVQAVSAVRNRKILVCTAASLLVLSVFASYRITRTIESGTNHLVYEYEYHTINEHWDELEEACLRQPWSAGTANYLNLAYAYKGCLVDNLFKHDNADVTFLMSIAASHTAEPRVAHIMYAMGNYAAAQDVAFNALHTVQGYYPAMLMMNARVEQLRGEGKVRDKYLSILEKSLHYRSWAREMKRRPLEGNILPEINSFAMFENPVTELMRVIEADPSNVRAMQYGLSFLLLAKDLPQLYRLVDSQWGSDALKSLPVPVQEALLFYSEYSRNVQGVDVASMDWCLSHGISTDVINHFAEFQRASISSKSSTPKGFQNTYWSYLL